MGVFSQNRQDQNREMLAKVLAAACIDHPILSTSIEAVGLEALVAAALKNGMGGLLLRTSMNLSISLNSAQENKCREQAMRTATVNVNTLGAFKRVAQKLLGADLPFLLLKGAPLNLVVYRRFDLRPMTDIDLLVHPADAERANQVLREYGCLPGRRLIREDFFPRYYYATEYYVEKPVPYRIDLHAAPFRPLRYMQTMPADALWDHPSGVSLEGLEVHYPSNENMLIHLAVHSAIHGNKRLFWLYDIFRFVQDRRRYIDWDLVRTKSTAWRLSLPVRRALEVTADLFDDEELKTACKHIDGPANWQDRLVLYQTPRDIAHPVAHIVTNLITTRGIGFRAAYLWAVLLPDAAHMKEVYPHRHPGWLLIAHLWRLVRPVVRWLRSLVRLAPLKSKRILLKVETAPGSG